MQWVVGIFGAYLLADGIYGNGISNSMQLPAVVIGGFLVLVALVIDYASKD